MATMRYREIEDGIVVVTHAAKDADDASWSAYVRAISASRSPSFRVVVFTDGGRATRDQFARIQQAFGDRYKQTLVFTANKPVRIFGTMMNAILSNLNAAFYPPEAVVEGLASFGIVDEAQVARIIDTARELASALIPGGRMEALGATELEHMP